MPTATSPTNTTSGGSFRCINCRRQYPTFSPKAQRYKKKEA
ncbi:hypothetical protein COO91_10130 (plasmid) [Nostoc flagelliforme CCNUN1]|uniref:Uncharacterized protein n=1 Tax=Nostoc flagelliforme CCNUN1 TaxID=2038116 RepID=A0A2K8T8D5_9NOSO|nr:hypothetical protein COO91_10130 [Nostoc flagelliforme CCNUN1]